MATKKTSPKSKRTSVTQSSIAEASLKKSSAVPNDTVAAETTSRDHQLKLTSKKLRFGRRPKHPVKLPSVWRLTRQAAGLLKDNWKLFGTVVVVYGALNILMVQGLHSSADVSQQLKQSADGVWGRIGASLNAFALLASAPNGSGSDTAPVYQFLLVLVASLAIVWLMRQVLAGKPVRARDGFYKGMYPLVPVLLVFLVVTLQLIPLLVGSGVYGAVVGAGLAATFIEKFLWGLLFFLLSLWSLYMIAGSVFALYIAALPAMTPMRALKRARELVRQRRWVVLRKLLFLPAALFVSISVIMLPFILFVTPIAAWVFFALGIATLAAVHAYMYTLYRELLQ